MMYRKKSLLLTVLLMITIVFVSSVRLQTLSGGQWYTGTGSAAGKDMERIKVEALNRARADALRKAGVEVNSGIFSLKSEENGSLIDFFSEFSESNARGLILDEKEIRFDRPEPLDSSYTVYRATAHVSALVATPRGRPDPSFEVSLIASRNTYKAYEPVTLHIRSTQPGYLTILDVHGDSLNVLFPNVIDRDNHISANTDFVFPPGKAYSLELETVKGEATSSDMFVAIVTKENIPFPNIEEIGLDQSVLGVAEKGLTTYAMWLYRIPSDRRAADSKLVEVQK